MTITNVKTGVLGVDDVYKKTLSAYFTYVDTTPAPLIAGSLFGWGNNFTGENLPPINNGKSSPVQIPGTTWSKVTGNADSFAAIKCDNTMWLWGTTAHGSRMANTSGSCQGSSPVQMPGTGWCALDRDQSNHFAIKTDGTLWSNGYGYYGANGDNTNTPRSSMVQIPGTTWCCISYNVAGTVHALKTDNSLWVWGHNNAGNLGINLSSGALVSSPTQIPGTWCYVKQHYAGHGIKSDGTMWGWGSGNRLGNNTNGGHFSSPVQIPGTTWCFTGGYEDGGIGGKTDGTLWMWGYNGAGNLGQNSISPSYFSSPVQIPGTTWRRACGANGNIIGIKSDGTLWSWGSGTGGGLGLNSNIPRSSPTQIPGTWCNFTAIKEQQALAIRQ